MLQTTGTTMYADLLSTARFAIETSFLDGCPTPPFLDAVTAIATLHEVAEAGGGRPHPSLLETLRTGAIAAAGYAPATADVPYDEMAPDAARLSQTEAVLCHRACLLVAGCLTTAHALASGAEGRAQAERFIEPLARMREDVTRLADLAGHLAVATLAGAWSSTTVH